MPINEAGITKQAANTSILSWNAFLEHLKMSKDESCQVTALIKKPAYETIFQDTLMDCA